MYQLFLVNHDRMQYVDVCRSNWSQERKVFCFPVEWEHLDDMEIMTEFVFREKTKNYKKYDQIDMFPSPSDLESDGDDDDDADDLEDAKEESRKVYVKGKKTGRAGKTEKTEKTEKGHKRSGGDSEDDGGDDGDERYDEEALERLHTA